MQSLKFMAAAIILSNGLASAKSTPYFECVNEDNGHTYRIVKKEGPRGAYDTFEYESEEGPFMPVIAHLQNNAYTKSGVKETPSLFEVWEKEDHSSTGLGPDGITLPAIAYQKSKFTLDKVSGKAKHVFKEVYMFITTKKEVDKFHSCYDLR